MRRAGCPETAPRRRRPGGRFGAGALRQAAAVAHAFRTRVLRRSRATPAGRRAGGRRPVLVGRQRRHSPAVSRLLHAARAAGRCPHVRHGAASARLGAHQVPSGARPSSLCHGADRRPRPPAARQCRPRLPRVVRPLLGGKQGYQRADRAGGLEGGARGGTDGGTGGAGAVAPRQRREPRRQDLVPAPAGGAAARRGLDRIRGRRRRSHGRPAVVRPARGTHPARGRRAYGLQEDRLVHPRHPADRLQRHAPGAGRQHPRPDPARDLRRPSRRMDGDIAGRHHAAPEAAPRAARRLRAGADGASGPGGHGGLGAGPRRPLGRGDGVGDRPALRGDSAELGPPVSQRGELPRTRARSPEADGQPCRQG